MESEHLVNISEVYAMVKRWHASRDLTVSGNTMNDFLEQAGLHHQMWSYISGTKYVIKDMKKFQHMMLRHGS